MGTQTIKSAYPMKLDCGHTIDKPDGFGAGYGADSDGRKYCYECCGKLDRVRMSETGRATLYLTHNDSRSWFDWRVGNWPGTLSFKPLYGRTGHHNIARKRYDVWFNGPDGHVWHGVTYGDNTQICHCRRTKERWRRSTESLDESPPPGWRAFDIDAPDMPG